MPKNRLSEGQTFKVHGHVDLAGLEDGVKYRVTSLEEGPHGLMYAVEPVDGGNTFKLRADYVDQYVDNEAFIELYQRFRAGFGYITVV